MAGLLCDFTATLDGVLLAALLVGQGLLGALVTGDVLHLGAVCRREHVLGDGAVVGDVVGVDDGEISVDPQGAVTLAVEHAEVLQYLLQFREKGPHLARPAEVRLRDDLHQRRPRAVVVHQRVVGAVDRGDPGVKRTGALGDVCERPGVLLQVGSADTHGAGVVADLDLQVAVLTDRGVVLGDLEVLRQVGVVVVLPVKAGLLGDRGVDCLADLHGGLDGALVQHRQRTGQAETHRTDVRVRLVGRRRGTATEDLRVGLQLHVDLQADHGREVLLNRLGSHQRAFWRGAHNWCAPVGTGDGPRLRPQSRYALTGDARGLSRYCRVQHSR